MIDPEGRPYAWYGCTLAHDASAVMALLEPDDVVRERMLRAGWSVRAGSGTELVSGGGQVAKASA